MSPLRVALAADLPPAIVEDYFQKRATYFGDRSGVPGFHAHRDIDDDRAYIALATDGEECLGGVRAVVRRPLEDDRPLPIEKDLGVSLPALFPRLALDRVPHADLSRMVICSKGQPLRPDNDIAIRLLRFLLLEGNPAPDVRYAFIASNAVRLRLYAMIGRMLGVHYQQRDVDPPEALKATGRNSVHAYRLP